MKKTWQKLSKNFMFYMTNQMVNSIGKTSEKMHGNMAIRNGKIVWKVV